MPVSQGTHAWTTWNQTYWYTSSGSSTATIAPTGGMLYDQAWVHWNSTSTTAITYSPDWQYFNLQYEETQEEAAARAQREVEYQAEQARWREEESARQTARQGAQRVARQLLEAVLTDEQRASLVEHGWFEVISNKGNRWRIRDRGQSGNVDLMPEIGEERVATYCAHPPDTLPAADAHLAQMLTLQTDEESFLAVANVHYRRRDLAQAM